MSYIRTSWVARVGTALNRFLKTNESAGSVELTADPTGVTTAGTPFTVDNMNKIEQGIYDAHVTADANATNLSNNVNQGVKTTDSPTFANATIGGHNVDGELDTLNSRVNQGVKTTDSPTFAKLTLTTSTYGSQDIDGNSFWVVPVGIYMLPSNGNTTIEMWDGSAWVVGGLFAEYAGVLISDGNIRLKAPTNGSTIYYRKFS